MMTQPGETDGFDAVDHVDAILAAAPGAIDVVVVHDGPVDAATAARYAAQNQVPVVAQHTGADSASVIFDAIQSAKSREVDVVIADTAGRLQNKDNLMNELEKVVRVMKKLDDSAPHEVMLVLDAGTGQNALSQAQVFQQAVGVSGITLTKLDGTAKGGIVFAIARQLQLPIRFIGVGEQVDDLRSFDAETFVDALFD